MRLAAACSLDRVAGAASSENASPQGHKKITPFFIPYAITNMAGALLAIDVGFMARSSQLATSHPPN